MFRWTIIQVGFQEILSAFHHFRNSSKKFSEFCWEFFGRVVTTAFYMYVGTFGGKLFSFRKIHKFFVVFGIWAANLLVLGELFLLAFLKMHSLLLQKHTWWKKNNFVQKIVSSSLLKFARVFRLLADNVTTGSQRFHCVCSDEHFNEQVFWKAHNFFILTGIRAKFFRVLTRKFWLSDHNCVLHVHRHFLRKVIFLSRNS